MNQLKKITALILTAALVVALTGCAGKGNGTLGEKEDREKLVSILDDIANQIRPGSAGNGLVAVRIAADLVSWAASSNMSKTEAAKVATDWVKQQPEADKEVLKEKLQSVSQAYGKIAVDGAKDLLKDAGVKDKLAELTGNLRNLVDSVLNEMQKYV